MNVANMPVSQLIAEMRKVVEVGDRVSARPLNPATSAHVLNLLDRAAQELSSIPDEREAVARAMFEHWHEAIWKRPGTDADWLATGDVYRQQAGILLEALKQVRGTFIPTHQHVKRGTKYRVVGSALMQASAPVLEPQVMTVYQGEDGRWWVRPNGEFNDGRFAEVTP